MKKLIPLFLLFSLLLTGNAFSAAKGSDEPPNNRWAEITVNNQTTGDIHDLILYYGQSPPPDPNNSFDGRCAVDSFFHSPWSFSCQSTSISHDYQDNGWLEFRVIDAQTGKLSNTGIFIHIVNPAGPFGNFYIENNDTLGLHFDVSTNQWTSQNQQVTVTITNSPSKQ